MTICRTASCSSSSSSSSGRCSNEMEDEKEWEEVVCPICMDHPHNAILLICSSHEKGCRPFVCNTGRLLSNCYDRLMKKKPFADSCPFCRGQITGFDAKHPARKLMNSMTRSCPLEEACSFSGSYADLRRHVRAEHLLDWGEWEQEGDEETEENVFSYDWGEWEQAEDDDEVFSLLSRETTDEGVDVVRVMVRGNSILHGGGIMTNSTRRSRVLPLHEIMFPQWGISLNRENGEAGSSYEGADDASENPRHSSAPQS